MLTLPAAASAMPTLAPPCEILNFTLLCLSLEYLPESSSSSGKEAVAPDIEIVVVAAYAIAGTATRAAIRTSEAMRRRGLRICGRAPFLLCLGWQGSVSLA